MADRWRSLDVFLHLLTPAILNLIVSTYSSDRLLGFLSSGTVIRLTPVSPPTLVLGGSEICPLVFKRR